MKTNCSFKTFPTYHGKFSPGLDMMDGTGAFTASVGVVLGRRGLYANRLCSILTGFHIVGKGEMVWGCTVKSRGEGPRWFVVLRLCRRGCVRMAVA